MFELIAQETVSPGLAIDWGNVNWLVLIIGVVVMLFGDKLPPKLLDLLKKLIGGNTPLSSSERDLNWKRYCELRDWAVSMGDSGARVVQALDSDVLPDLPCCKDKPEK